MDVLLGLFDQHHPLLYVMLYRADGSESTNFRNKAFQSINQSMKMKMKMMKIKVKMSMMIMKKVSHDDGYFVMKVIL